MNVRTLAAPLLLSFAVACAGAESRGTRGPVLRGVPIIAGSNVLDSMGTEETLRLRFLVSMHRDSVASFYRRVLTERGWRIVGDGTEGDVVQLYAERDGPPLWIQIRSAGPGVAQYTLIGAQAQDSTAGRPR